MTDLGGIVGRITVEDGQARVALQQFGQLSNTVSSEFSQNVASMGNSMQTFNMMVNLYMVKAVADLAESFIGIGANFEYEMSNVESILSGTDEEMQALTNTTRELAAATQYTATQTAEAAGLIAQAGKDAYETIALLPDVLNLASAGAMEVASAANYLVSSEAALSLSQEEVNHLVDEFAQTANATNSDVAQLGEGFTTVGATASVLSSGITEINTVLGILANANIKGAEGGTKLRNMIVSLTAPTDKAADALANLGVEVADSQGNMRELYDILQDINQATSSMGDVDRMSVLADIFNGRDLAAVQSIMNTLPDEYHALYEEIDNCAGAAQKMADTKMDNLKGDLLILESNLQETALQFGDLIQDGLRNAIQTISELVIEFNEMDSGVKAGIVSVTKIVAAFGGLAVVNTIVSKGMIGFQGLISKTTQLATTMKLAVTSQEEMLAAQEASEIEAQRLLKAESELSAAKKQRIIAIKELNQAQKEENAVIAVNVSADQQSALVKAQLAVEQAKNTVETRQNTVAKKELALAQANDTVQTRQTTVAKAQLAIQESKNRIIDLQAVAAKMQLRVEEAAEASQALKAKALKAQLAVGEAKNTLQKKEAKLATAQLSLEMAKNTEQTKQSALAKAQLALEQAKDTLQSKQEALAKASQTVEEAKNTSQTKQSAVAKAELALKEAEETVQAKQAAVAKAQETAASTANTAAIRTETIAAQARNTVMSLGVSFLLTTAITAIGAWITKKAEANKEAKEFNTTLLETIRLQNEYNELSDPDKEGKTDEYNHLKSVLDDLNTTYEALVEKEKEFQDAHAVTGSIKYNELIEQLTVLRDAYESQKEAIEENYGTVEVANEKYKQLSAELSNSEQLQKAQEDAIEQVAEAWEKQGKVLDDTTKESIKSLVQEKLTTEGLINAGKDYQKHLEELIATEKKDEDTKDDLKKTVQELRDCYGEEAVAVDDTNGQYIINYDVIEEAIKVKKRHIDSVNGQIAAMEKETEAIEENNQSLLDQCVASGAVSEATAQEMQTEAQHLVSLMNVSEMRATYAAATGQSVDDVMGYTDAELQALVSALGTEEILFYGVQNAKSDEAVAFGQHASSIVNKSKEEVEALIDNNNAAIQSIKTVMEALGVELKQYQENDKALGINSAATFHILDELSAKKSKLSALEEENQSAKAFLKTINGTVDAVDSLGDSAKKAGGKAGGAAKKASEDALEASKKIYEQQRDLGKLSLEEQAERLVQMKNKYSDTAEHIIAVNEYGQSEFKRIIQERVELGELTAEEQVAQYEYVYNTFCKSESDKLAWTKTISSQIVENAKSTYEEMETFSEKDAETRVAYLENIAKQYPKYGEVVEACNEGIIDILGQTSKDVEDLDEDTLQSRINYLNKYLTKYQGNKEAVVAIEKSLTTLINQQDSKRLSALDETTKKMATKWNEIKNIESEIRSKLEKEYEDSLDNQVKALESSSESKVKIYEDERDAQIEMYNQELEALKASINAKYDAVVSGYQAQINAIKNLQNERADWEKEVALRNAIDNAETQQEYEDAVAEYQKWQYEQNEQAQVDSLQNKIDAANNARDEELQAVEDTIAAEIEAAQNKYDALIEMENTYKDERKASLEAQKEDFSISESELTALAVAEYDKRQAEEQARMDEINKYMEEVFKNDLLATNQGISDALLKMADSTSESILDYIDTWETKLEAIKKEMDSLGSASSYSSGNTYNGSHSQGLDYVPFDDYKAKLHRGERVLTEAENKRYEAQQNGQQVKIVQEKFDDSNLVQKLNSLEDTVKRLIIEIPRQQAINQNKRSNR